MTFELEQIDKLFQRLCDAKEIAFPRPRKPLKASAQQGVYVIRDQDSKVLQVGWTIRARMD